jgi:uncharacterized membrane protein YdbT with pleckstrin-like domain
MKTEETTLYVDSPSMFRNRPITFFVVAITSLVGIGLPFLVGWWLRCRSTELTVTDRRTRLCRGWLGRSITEVWHRDVRNVQLDQTFFQRLVGTGRIGLSSSAQSGIEIDVSGLKNPQLIKELVDRYRSS